MESSPLGKFHPLKGKFCLREGMYRLIAQAWFMVSGYMTEESKNPGSLFETEVLEDCSGSRECQLEQRLSGRKWMSAHTHIQSPASLAFS